MEQISNVNAKNFFVVEENFDIREVNNILVGNSISNLEIVILNNKDVCLINIVGSNNWKVEEVGLTEVYIEARIPLSLPIVISENDDGTTAVLYHL